jgi:hypothetical protein
MNKEVLVQGWSFFLNWTGSAWSLLVKSIKAVDPFHAALGAVVVCHVLYFSDILWGGYAYSGTDLLAESFFNLKFSLESILRDGLYPFWNPYVGCGAVNIDLTNILLFHPVNALLLVLLPFKNAFNVIVALSPVIAGITMFLYARTIKLTPRACFVVAITYSMGGIFTSIVLHLGSMQSLAYIPLLLYVVEKSMERAKWYRVLWLAPALVMQNLGGHPQYTLYGGILLVGYSVFRLYFSYRQGQIVSREVVNYSVFFFLSIILALGICAFWITTFYDALRSGVHQGGAGFSATGSLNPLMFFNFISPNFFGKNDTDLYWARGLADSSTYGYVGLLPLLLAGIAVVESKRKDMLVNFYVITGVLGLFLALGQFNPLFAYLIKLPVFNFTRCFSRFAVWYVFAVSVLAGIGYQYLFEKSVMDRVLQRWQRFMGFFILGMLALVVFVGVFLQSFRAPVLGCLKTVFRDHFFGKPPFNFRLIEYYYTFIDSYPQKIMATINLGYPYFLMTFLSALGVFVFLYCLRRKLFGRVVPYAAAALIAVPLFYTGKTYLQPDKAVLLNEEPGVVKIIHARGVEEGRVCTMVSLANAAHVSSDFLTQRELLLPSSNISSGLFSVNVLGYSYDGHYYDVVDRIMNARTLEDVVRYKNVLNLLNVAYVLSPTDLSSAGFQEVARTPTGMRVYHNPGRLPRAFFVERIEVQSDPGRRLDQLLRFDFDFKKMAIVEEDVPLSAPSSLSASRVSGVRYDLDMISLRVYTEARSFLVISDIYSRGWSCFIDGARVKVYRTNHAFKGVVVPEGEHSIVFKYKPPALAWGVIISTISLGVFILVLGTFYFLNKRGLK